jgi:hypothetical protein
MKDVAGNRSTADEDNYTLDSTEPAAPRFTAEPDSPDRDRSPRWEWTGDGGGHAQCLVSSGGTVIRDWAACSSPHTVYLGGRPDGTYRLRVRIIDAADNVGPAATSSYTLDSSTPTPGPGDSPPPPTHGDGGGSPTPDGGSPDPVDHHPGGGSRPGADPSTLPPDARDHAAAGVPSDRGDGGSGLKPPAQPPEDTESEHVFPVHVPEIGDVPTVIGKVAVKSLEKPQFPLALLVVAALFLLVQNRVDRRDPKLATAPVEVEPHLFFGPVVES